MCTRATHHFARALRRESADAERLLWFHLRDRQLAGVGFQRQQPVGPFIAGFLAADPGLIVEVDSAGHGRRGDTARQAFLSRRGFHVLQVGSHDVLVRTEQVLELIHAALASRCRCHRPVPRASTTGSGPQPPPRASCAPCRPRLLLFGRPDG